MKIEEKIEKYLNEEKFKEGDYVHLPLKDKGGAGFKGKIKEIKGDEVWVENDEGKVYKGKLKNLTKAK